jgi:hypothetical protein
LGKKKLQTKTNKQFGNLGKTEKQICEHDVQHDVTDESHHHIMRI